MGLDMYAYAVATKLLKDDQQTDVPVSKITREAVGFIDITPDEIDALAEQSREIYFQQRRDADTRAETQGLIIPEFAYWRKFNHLHGWMENLYRAKGGTAESFNCTNVRLNEQDLDTLEVLANNKAMPATPGFFFGSYEPFDEADKKEVLDFVTKARDAMKNGMTIFYDSWW
jgi:hypothetical protein